MKRYLQTILLVSAALVMFVGKVKAHSMLFNYDEESLTTNYTSALQIGIYI